MKKLLLLFFVSAFFLVSCGGKDIPEVHNDYLLQHNWHIKKFQKAETKVLDHFPEYYESLRIADLDLKEYEGKEVTITSYLLKEKQINGEKMTAHIYEYDGDIIGGHGVLANWSPGLFSLTDKQRLMDEGIMKK
ncbi:hypothetical protein HNQ94_000835 [Salirhabdus euzebyi]|uniref:DUF4830 domain-containing protein n=1 Tax=Salirhabdus euzebyi TaxID=394506 RepID=A0A841PUB1_9BACI|nr:DUF4830 domain-containing protein [Salirhabdus euzebyi]MBB6452390.1 hypothetical protein [Salirhabdus euzebyi]